MRPRFPGQLKAGLNIKMEKLVVGLVGPLGSGKTTVAGYLVSQGYKSLRFSDPINKEVLERGLKIERKVQQDVGDELREKHGNDYISQLLVKEINVSRESKFVVEGFRNPAEIGPFRKLKRFILVGLVADPKVRFERLVGRGQERDPKVWEDFGLQDERDQGIDQPEHGQNVRGCLELADFVVDTDSPLAEVYNRVVRIIEEAK